MSWVLYLGKHLPSLSPLPQLLGSGTPGLLNTYSFTRAKPCNPKPNSLSFGVVSSPRRSSSEDASHHCLGHLGTLAFKVHDYSRYMFQVALEVFYLPMGLGRVALGFV